MEEPVKEINTVVVERWLDRNNPGKEPQDLKLACQELIAMLQCYRHHDEDDGTATNHIDPVAMMRRMPLRELYQYLSQQIWYYKNVHSKNCRTSDSCGDYDTAKDSNGGKQTRTTTVCDHKGNEFATITKTLNEMVIQRRTATMK